MPDTGTLTIQFIEPLPHCRLGIGRTCGSGRWELLDQSETVVGQLAGSFEAPDGMHCTFATVMAVITWDGERSATQFQDGLRCENWEVVVPELVLEPARSPVRLVMFGAENGHH